jgi:hypothetical protein
VLCYVAVVGSGGVLWWLEWLGLGRGLVSCVVCDAGGLYMTYNRVKDYVRFYCHLIV